MAADSHFFAGELGPIEDKQRNKGLGVQFPRHALDISPWETGDSRAAGKPMRKVSRWSSGNSGRGEWNDHFCDTLQNYASQKTFIFFISTGDSQKSHKKKVGEKPIPSDLNHKVPKKSHRRGWLEKSQFRVTNPPEVLGPVQTKNPLRTCGEPSRTRSADPMNNWTHAKGERSRGRSLRPGKK